ncbi:MAG: tRNA uridine-5-carboxymethylaminomethyl(34) synthesis enzyme MnmG [Lachnospiraceae bacterium]|nr:tRNA uridine-5-carboxymethylaminomethyl(34) synthesis enzyme MnmG [Lachnospiraceae bacterium]
MIEEYADVVIVGAGHAGCEAALACARLGLETVVFTMSVEAIAMMPCNPHIGGSSKGHLVREIDALGGEMARCIDRTFLQSKMLNRSKGPAVHSLRAQADKAAYSARMRHTLEQQEHLQIRQQEVTQILTDENNVLTGVKTISGTVWHCRAAVLCTGTYLNARCIYGDVSLPTGPNGTPSANYLTDSLKEHGISMNRFKTGTPARMDGKTIDFSKMVRQDGDVPVIPFSFETDPDSVQIEQVPVYLTHTNEETHRILRENLDRSPLYSGQIKGTGPRYCPSIEDKVVRFADKESHQVFVEPQGRDTNEMYIDGMSSSMPEDVQVRMYRTVPGLENAKIVKMAYAIEYDCVNALQLDSCFEFKAIPGLYAGGQFNGSSGYEEAAAQGLYAGINAALKILGREPLFIDRSEAYIGVLVDDLITKENHEPYRMMTSRAEYRLLLRQDNADMRLLEKGYRVGLISEERYQRFLCKKQMIRDEISRVEAMHIGAGQETQKCLQELGSTPLTTSATMAELIRRPELTYQKLAPLDPKRPSLPPDVQEEVEIEIKYEGYIARQQRQVEQFRKMEERRIPEDLDYDKVPSLRNEARQKLKEVRPSSIGQASRVMGVNPADVAVLLVYLKK